MASRKVAAPSCPDGHLNTAVIARGTRQSKRGVLRRWSCSPRKGEEGATHFFTTVAKPKRRVREVLDEVAPPPPCPFTEHRSALFKVKRKGTYDTTAGTIQRYECRDVKTGATHRYSAPLPRKAVLEESTCCPDCGVPTPANAGTEAAARYNGLPVEVIYTALKELAEGGSYSEVSLSALDAAHLPRGRTRKVPERPPDAPKPKRKPRTGPARDAKAHWHVAADILERFAPIVITGALAAVDAEQDAYREAGLPVVYIADEQEVKRSFARTSRTATTAVWQALVVSRVRWEDDQGQSWSNRLHRVRALPRKTKEAWKLVFSELPAPDFLVADGSAAIEQAAVEVWGEQVTFVPCVYHAVENMKKGIVPAGMLAPLKVTDHFFTFKRENMAAGGTAFVASWFDDLEAIVEAAELPLDGVRAVRAFYEPLMNRSAVVAQNHASPMVPISNGGVESVVRKRINKLIARRGPMMTNLPRTNLLGDLMVAGSNGALADQHTVCQAIKDATRGTGGWSAPPRILTEPLGALGLRDPLVLTILAQGGTP